MLDALIWWLSLQLLGLLVLPVTLHFFKNLRDRGYAFSKPLGLVVVSYLFWLLGTAHILPNTRLAILLVVLVVAAAAAIAVWLGRGPIRSFFAKEWRLVLATEVVFTGFFVLWAVLRAYNPQIAHTEQPMDLAMVNGIYASPSFPPNDPWLSGHTISYYYFGYLQNAMLAKFTGVPSSIAYNLALASTAAMAAVGVFALVVNMVLGDKGTSRLRTAFWFGLAVNFLFLFLGNLVGFLEFLRSNGAGSASFWHWIGIDGLTAPSGATSWHPTDTWWWWRSTRVINTFVGGHGIDYTITEFPLFSFMLGDLHPHVMSLPFVMLSLGISLNVLRSNGAMTFSWLKTYPHEGLLAALLLGALGFLNSWDLPTFAAVFVAALLLLAFRQKASLRSALALGAVIAIAAVVLYAPFYATLRSQASGILPIDHVQTRPLHYIIFWGPLLFIGISLLLALAWDKLQGRSPDGDEASKLRAALFAVLPLVLFLLWALAELVIAITDREAGSGLLSIGSRFWHLLPLLVILSLSLHVLQRMLRKRDADSSQFALLLLFSGILLTMVVELFYIVDLFGTRMNTVFKFYYQAWALMAVASAYGLYYLAGKWQTGSLFKRALGYGWWAVAGILILAAFLYSPTAIDTMTSGFGEKPTLDGLAFAAQRSPDEFKALDWLRHNATGDAVIVEAVPLSASGQPLGDYNPAAGRVSGRTGLSAVLGWPGHENQWRGGSAKQFEDRAKDVDTVYRSQDPELAQSLLTKYNVKYVFVGDLELATYGPQVVGRLSFMQVAFRSGNVVIFSTTSGTPTQGSPATRTGG